MSTLTHQALFSDLPAKPKSLPAAFLLLALLLHLAVLLLEGQERNVPYIPTTSLEVQLTSPPVSVTAVPETLTPETPAEVDVPPAAPLAPETEPAETSPVTNPATELPEVIAPGRPIEDQNPAADRPVTTIDRHALLEAVSGMDWSEPSAEPGLQRPATEGFGSSFYRPVLPRDENAFDGTVLPTETETVDQWQEPGGEHRVVIKGIDGEHYCGRQMPLDDMRPWTQMPMLFHRCGGGGKRSGVSDWRNN